ncbi:hypothetical protein VNO77_36928 [Canavalia gladiata]|uniref:Uncharacterized protein n=1 Tax=Canavalia gladiata TaxID=3824 RepID=A0AAN9KBL8_CANGL
MFLPLFFASLNNVLLGWMLITGLGIQCFPQISGIDATVYYSPWIFQAAGIEDNSKLLAATVSGRIPVQVMGFLLANCWKHYLMQQLQGNALQEKDLEPPRSIMEICSMLRKDAPNTSLV